MTGKLKSNWAVLMLAICSALIVLSALPVSAQPVNVVDDLGRRITLAGPPIRIVSLEPSVTEILYAVGAARKIVADDDYSDYPREAKSKPHVNGIGPSREMMIGLHPDLILLYDQTFTSSKADDWQHQYGVPVYVLSAGTYQGIEADIQRVGNLAGNAKATASVLNSMDSAVKSVREAVVRRPIVTAFVVVWDRPLMTAGRGSYIDDLIRIAGGKDIASCTAVGYPTYSPERLVADNPSVLLIGTTGNTVIRQTDPALSSLNLSANHLGRSFAIPDDWTSRPGPRLAIGLLAVARVLHPEAFRN